MTLLPPNPQVFTATEIYCWHSEEEIKPGYWRLPRPVPYWGICLGRRIKLAWLVFTGQMDVLVWDPEQFKKHGITRS